MRTWNASGWQVFCRLRWPASVPFLFASLKVGAVAALVEETLLAAGSDVLIAVLPGDAACRHAMTDEALK